MSEDAAIFGGWENLKAGIARVIEKFRPGRGRRHDLRAHRDHGRRRAERDRPVPRRSTRSTPASRSCGPRRPDYCGSLQEGYAAAVEAILSTLAEGGARDPGAGEPAARRAPHARRRRGAEGARRGVRPHRPRRAGHRERARRPRRRRGLAALHGRRPGRGDPAGRAERRDDLRRRLAREGGARAARTRSASRPTGSPRVPASPRWTRWWRRSPRSPAGRLPRGFGAGGAGSWTPWSTATTSSAARGSRSRWRPTPEGRSPASSPGWAARSRRRSPPRARAASTRCPRERVAVGDLEDLEDAARRARTSSSPTRTAARRSRSSA